MKVMSIFGTRPEVIRLSRIFSLLDKNFEHVMVNTHQNYTNELNSIFFRELQVRRSDYNLNITTGQFAAGMADNPLFVSPSSSNTSGFSILKTLSVLLIISETSLAN